ncbi:tissue factor pathway inhibitor 2 [Aplochiton taeniatus]
MDMCFLTLVALFSTIYNVFALQRKEVCLLQVDEGPCRGDILRYYYNTISQQCEKFSYGGCQGNTNNFLSYEECRKTCFKIPKIPQICRFKKEVGPCRASLPSFFFNMTSMQCEPFSYGGCQGNINRFIDFPSCKEYCSPHKTLSVVCLGPPDKGRCAASIPRYYYNSASRTCEEFMYSGCGGSNNNFISRKDCMNVCAEERKPARYPSIKNRNRIRRKPNLNIVRG